MAFSISFIHCAFVSVLHLLTGIIFYEVCLHSPFMPVFIISSKIITCIFYHSMVSDPLLFIYLTVQIASYLAIGIHFRCICVHFKCLHQNSDTLILKVQKLFFFCAFVTKIFELYKSKIRLKILK